MRKLGRGYCFSKIDLANAYNQICLSPDSQKKLALSTHKGVLLQKRLPFGIKSAPGYFQEIMEQLTQNLRGVAVYFDDNLVSGDNAKDHLRNVFQHRWQVFNHSIPHLSYGLIIWQGSEHWSLLTLFPTTSKHKFFLPTNLTPFTKCLAT